MQFLGLKPWPQNEPVIECFQGDRWFDLHNCADFLGFEWDASGSLKLSFAFRPSVHCPDQLDTRDTAVCLRFGAVQRACIEQENDWVPEQGDELNYMLRLADQHDRSSVEVKAGGIVLNFTCASLEMILGD